METDDQQLARELLELIDKAKVPIEDVEEFVRQYHERKPLVHRVARHPDLASTVHTVECGALIGTDHATEYPSGVTCRDCLKDDEDDK